MKKRYGYCICHNIFSSLNAKNLCPVGVKERHERSAESKGLTIKKKGNGLDNTRERNGFDSIQKPVKRDSKPQLPIPIQKSAACKKAKINHRSEKGKELAGQELLLFQKLFRERPPSCVYCGVEIKVFSPINYHHIRTKGSHPELRLVESNIVKICANCHLKEHSFKPKNRGRN